MNNQSPRYRGFCFPSEIISHAVWLYHRLCLSFREVEMLLTKRGITVTYETIRQWCQKFGSSYARKLKRRQGRLGDTWHIDEVLVTIQGSSTISGGPSNKMAMPLVSWCDAVAISARVNDFSAACSKAKGLNRGG